MDEVRCPMCGESNSAEAEVCEFCEARLKPLQIGEPPADIPGEAEPLSPSEEEEAAETPDWLARIRSQAEEDTLESEMEAEDDLAAPGESWLERLRETESEGEQEAEDELRGLEPMEPEDIAPPEQPAFEEPGVVWEGEPTGREEPAEESEEPDWLARLRQAETGSADDLVESEEVPDWLEGQEPQEILESEAMQPPTGITDLLEGKEGDEEPPDARASASAETVGAEEEPAEEPPEEGVPEWLSEMPEVSEEEEGPPEGEIPDWLSEFGREAGVFEEGVDATEAAGWLEDLRAPEPEEADEIEPFPPDPEPGLVEPEFAEEVEAESLEEEGAEEAFPEFEPEEEPEPDQLEVEEQPPVPTPETPFAPDAEIDPEWFRGLDAELEGETEDAVDDLPHVPALVSGEEEGQPPSETGEVDFDAIDFPEWMGDARAATGEAPGEGEELAADITPAKLPSWLEAMRPVETFRPVVELEPEEEQVVESVGPLAGLRGVLSAEPVVAKPRASTIGGVRLEVTERQFAQADLLRRMVEEEQREAPVEEVSRIRLPVLRWIIGALLLVAVALPIILGLPSFPLPSRVPRDLGPLINLVNDLPAESPVLLVIDYEPGFSGELDAVGGALLEHLMARDLRVVTLSTRPTGPPLADRLLRRIGAAHGAENGKNYLHLGYLSGGPTAVQLFSAAPREVVLRGFELPQDPELRSGWESPILEGVDRLSDFGMVAVITAGPDNARVWAEQAHPWMGDASLVMVLSAGAEPLVRPYFEALEPQVNGILTGLPAAVAYEQVNGDPADAQGRWDGFGSGMLVAELILLAGLVYGIGSWLVQLRSE